MADSTLQIAAGSARSALASRIARPDWPALLTWVVFGIVAVVVLTPLTLTLLSSFQLNPPGKAPVYGLAGWQAAFSDPSILRAFGNTISLSVVGQLLSLVIGVGLAWLIARTDLPWRQHLEFLFWISFFLPSLPLAMGWILLLDSKFGLVNEWLRALPWVTGPVFDIYSFWGIVWVHLTHSLGVKVLLLTPAFRNMDAVLEEAARMCGASTMGTFRRIVIPLMAPAILITVILGLIRSLDAFEIELLLGTPVGLFVYSTKIRDLVTYEPPQYAPAAALGTVFLFLLLGLVAIQRWYLGQRIYHTVTGKAFSARPIHLGRWRWPTFGIVAAIALICSIVPVGMLALGTFMRAFGYFNIAQAWGLQHWERVFRDPQLLQSLGNTMLVGFATAAIGIVVYGLIAYTIVRTRFAGRGLLDFLAWLPWAVPGILMSIALLESVLRVPFLVPLYGSAQVLMLALVVKGMPFGVQTTKSVLLQLGNELEEAAWMSGGSWLQTYLRVLIPLLAPALITVGLIGFMSATRDISTLVLLSSSKTRTMSLLALDYAAGGQFESATVIALLTVLLVVAAALLARMIGGKAAATGHG